MQNVCVRGEGVGGWGAVERGLAVGQTVRLAAGESRVGQSAKLLVYCGGLQGQDVQKDYSLHHIQIQCPRFLPLVISCRA